MKLSRQQKAVLYLLRHAGKEGVSNVNLNEICFRYGARIWELRSKGFQILTKRISDGVYAFILLQEPEEAGVPAK